MSVFGAILLQNSPASIAELRFELWRFVGRAPVWELIVTASEPKKKKPAGNIARHPRSPVYNLCHLVGIPWQREIKRRTVGNVYPGP